VSGNVFRNDAWNDELEQIIGAAGFRAAAAHFESSKWMATDNRACAGAIDVNVAGANFRLGAFDVCRAAREKPRGQRELRAVRNLERFSEIADFDNAEHGPENLFAGNLGPRTDVGEDRRRNKKAFLGNISALESETRFLFAAFDVSKNVLVRLAVDHRSHGDTWIFRVSNMQTTEVALLLSINNND